jgi:DNA repair exonuclease SbcCD nuclease subunit
LIRFLHTADWQIGKLFGQFDSDEAALIAEARFKAVERLASLATEHNVSLVLIAGDVFDAQGVSDKTIYRLFNSMAGFNGPWVVIPGNHDAGLSESVWTRASRLRAIPSNISICLRPEPLVFESAGVAVLPAPLTQRHSHSDLTQWFDRVETPAGMYRIGLAHGCVQGILAEGIDSTNPIAAGRAEQAALDYLALGDWHGTKQVDDRTWYSGTPETDRFKSNDSGQALLVELLAPRALPVVTQVQTGQYRWQSDTMTLQVPSDVDLVLQRLSTLAPHDVVQLGLSGQTDLTRHRELHDAIERAKGQARGLLTDLAGLRLAPTEEDIEYLHADGYLGEVIAELRSGQSESREDVSKDALALLTDILDERRTRASLGGTL